MQQICISQSYSTGTGTGSTTTLELRQSNTQWNKIRGFSVDILELLNDCGGLTTIELANRLGKYPKYVTKYLYNLRSYGLINLNKNNWKWYITALDDIIIYIIYKEERKKKEERNKEETNNNLSTKYKNEKPVSDEPKEPKQTTLDNWQKERTDTEVVVVSYLVEHFHETMNKFVLCTSHDEFAELLRIGFPESSELPKTLLRLESDGVLYNVYLREKACWKIGLKDAFINRIRFC